MKAAMRLEEFGSAYTGWDKSGPWIAKILGRDDEFGLRREFMRFRRDYSNASSTGNRGIWRYYALEPGIYEVNRRTSWKHVERFFVQITDDAAVNEIAREDVETWLNAISE